MSKLTIVLVALALCAYAPASEAAATAATPATAATAATPATAATAATPATAATAATPAKRETNPKDAFPPTISSIPDYFKDFKIPFAPFVPLSENDIINLKPAPGSTLFANSRSETKKVVIENGQKVVDEDKGSSVTNDNGNVSSTKFDIEKDA